MKLTKEIKEFVLESCRAVNDEIDYLEDLIDDYIDCKYEAPSPLTEELILWDAYKINKVKSHMSYCEDMIEQIVKIILKDDHFECDDLDMCYRLYFECSNRYEKFKLTTYQSFLSYNYFKYERKIEKGEYRYE